jgi:hypothetical protein
VGCAQCLKFPYRRWIVGMSVESIDVLFVCWIVCYDGVYECKSPLE